MQKRRSRAKFCFCLHFINQRKNFQKIQIDAIQLFYKNLTTLFILTPVVKELSDLIPAVSIFHWMILMCRDSCHYSHSLLNTEVAMVLKSRTHNALEAEWKSVN